MPPQQNNQYDFIMNKQQPAKGFNFGGSTKVRIAIAGAGFVILAMIALTITSFFNQAGRAQIDRLTEVAQAQTEIIRISAIGQDKAKSADTATLALNTKLSTQSAQNQVKTALNKRGIGNKNLDKTLGLGKNNRTDQTLDEAEKNNRFDETFLAILNQQLSDYQKLLKNAHSEASATEKKILSASFESAANLAAPSAQAEARD